MDTKFYICEISSPSLSVPNPSLRYSPIDDVQIQPRNVLPPYYKMNTADVLANDSEMKVGELYPLFLLGRRLWAPKGNSDLIKFPSKLIDLARRKLFGGRKGPNLTSLASKIISFAVCANLKVGPTYAMCRELVSFHKATLIGVSETDVQYE